ncbi:endoplasmic reticulum vesicle transporter-domain-containing protein, partial [Blyttiomyces helicus]
MRWATRLDAFPKIERNIQNATGSGGLLTILVSALLAYLAFSEFAAYRHTQQTYEFLVDQTRSKDHALQINVDLTVSMNCEYVRADVLDLAGVSLSIGNEFKKTPVNGLHDGRNAASWVGRHARGRGGGTAELGGFPDVSCAKQGCRIVGSVKVNKVTGMLHFTAPGHGYFGKHVAHDAINFTHRIDTLSFGRHYPGLQNPLDHTLEVAESRLEMFQYFVAVVPTIYIDTNRVLGQRLLLTNQYAVTDYSRIISAESRTSGLPGIFIKYDIEPISVRITESRQGFLHFITRLCGIIGG